MNCRLQFILGRAGTGKTHACREAILAELRRDPRGHPLLLLVPEQFSFQMERELAAAPDMQGFLRLQVLGFRRLAARVLEEVGGAARPRLTEVGRLMAVRSLLHRHRARLGLFARTARRRGFVEQLAGTLAELRAYAVDADRLEAAARRLADRGGGPPGLAAKLADLIFLARAYEEYLADKFLDPDELLSLAAPCLPRSGAIQGVEVWVDGFAGFTPQEYLMLDGLFRVARRVHLSLCLDPAGLNAPLEDADVFFPTRDTHLRLTSRALAAGVSQDAPLMLTGGPRRFPPGGELDFLERHYERPPTAGAFPRLPRAIRLVQAADRQTEVEMAARELIRLARDEGYRWRDAAIMVRDVGSYRDHLAPLDDHGIPYFLDERRPATHHPLVELVRSAAEIVAGGWRTAPVLRYLKTDLLPLPRDQVDRLENRLRRWTTGGGGWPGMDSLPEDMRRPALGALESLLASTGGKTLSAAEWAGHFRTFLGELEVQRRLETWQAEALAEGWVEGVQEGAQIWSSVVGVLDELASGLGDQPLEPAALPEILETGLAAIRIGMVPPALDQVLVGQVDRSRVPDVRIAMVLGVNDGEFPRPAAEDPIFDDDERELLEAEGLGLAPSSCRRALREGYLGYIALTRPSERLWVSWSCRATNGKALAPSGLVYRVRALFPGLCPTDGGPEDWLADERAARAGLARALRRAGAGHLLEPFWAQLDHWFRGRGGDAEAPVAAGEGRRPSGETASPSLPRELVAAIYGDPIRAGVTQLELFAACPHAHFLRYGLGLREPSRRELEPQDIGIWLHAAVSSLLEAMDRQGVDWSPEASAAREQLAVDVLAATARGREAMSPYSRFTARLLARSFRRVVGMLALHGRRSAFRPVARELAFGRGRALPVLEWRLGGGARLELEGRIDQVDMARGAAGSYLRVIDHKSTVRRLSPAAVAAGVDLQLLCYLLAVDESAEQLAGGGKATVAGAFYSPLLAGFLRRSRPLSPAEAEAARLAEFRLTGLALAEPEAIRLMDAGQGDSPPGYLVRVPLRRDGLPREGAAALDRESWGGLLSAVRHRIGALGERMAAGEVGRRPFRLGADGACQRCDYRSVCGFDRLLGDAHRVARLRGSWTELAEEGMSGGVDGRAAGRH
ncbi:MAG TPA: PD-(D/E)XK nuclease family protein [Bacillota bacterium]|nr:PD-(D/E)XK nuclease family protein [Bacillota bacterium]